MTPSGDRHLGMDRPITRRDFLQGVALGAAAYALPLRGALAQGEPPPRAPAGGGGGAFRGQDADALRLGHFVRDRLDEEGVPKDVADTGERYDLVVVGAGLAGLGAAYAFHRAKEGRAKILILDAHEEIGGHARRNEFDLPGGGTLVAHGGTYALEDPDESPPEVMAMLREVGADPERMARYRDRSVQRRLKLSTGVFFDGRVFGGKTSWANGFYSTAYADFFAKAPVSAKARAELTKLYTTREDYLPGVEDKRAALRGMSWESFIRDRMKLGDDALRFANLYATDLIGLGADGVSAEAAALVGPGFAGTGGEGFAEKDGILRPVYDAESRFPDGCHTIARLFLRAILPEAFPDAAPDPESVFTSRFDPAALDRPERSVRVRFRAMAIRIENKGEKEATVVYLRPDGRAARVRAGGVVMAGWGMVAKRVVPGIPPEQRRALAQYRYAACVYVSVLLRQWRPIADLGLYDMYTPGGFATSLMLSDPLRVGRYKPDYEPTKPTILSVHRYLTNPGMDPTTQMKLARIDLEQTPFETIERQVREELLLLFGAAGLDPKKDILGITINRWGHGYAFFSQPNGPEAPWLEGRARLGRIAFAGADAGGVPWTPAALEQGRRAALELV